VRKLRSITQNQRGPWVLRSATGSPLRSHDNAKRIRRSSPPGNVRFPWMDSATVPAISAMIIIGHLNKGTRCLLWPSEHTFCSAAKRIRHCYYLT
jgi:hypothetical protein